MNEYHFIFVKKINNILMQWKFCNRAYASNGHTKITNNISLLIFNKITKKKEKIQPREILRDIDS